MTEWLSALVLGLVEGLTEFIPVSSTGHILLLGHFLGFQSPDNTFEVLIQLGAILAIVTVYFQRLWGMALNVHRDPAVRRFIVAVVLAFLPAAVLGVLMHDFIKTVLFETPTLICINLIVGGVLLLWVDKKHPAPVHHDAAAFPWRTAFGIGLFQCLALVPGVSRSGSTIAGALLLRCDKRAAAEFSFFLAMPTMAGAFAVDLYRNYDRLRPEDAGIIAVGFLAAFVAGVLVVRKLLDFVARHGYTPFALWRIFVGVIGLAGLALVAR